MLPLHDGLSPLKFNTLSRVVCCTDAILHVLCELSLFTTNSQVGTCKNVVKGTLNKPVVKEGVENRSAHRNGRQLHFLPKLDQLLGFRRSTHSVHPPCSTGCHDTGVHGIARNLCVWELSTDCSGSLGQEEHQQHGNIPSLPGHPQSLVLHSASGWTGALAGPGPGPGGEGVPAVSADALSCEDVGSPLLLYHH